MGDKYIPIDAESDTRLVETGPVRWTWYLPWACGGCKRFGRIVVVIPTPEEGAGIRQRGTTDEQMKEAIDREHHELSPMCLGVERRAFLGRVYRVKKSGQKIYLRGEGEREEDIREQAWPPWVT